MEGVVETIRHCCCPFGSDPASAIQEFIGFRDNRTSKIVARIANEQVARVVVGVYWFVSICQQMGFAPDSAFKDLIKEYSVKLTRPFNHSARAEAGIPHDWYDTMTIRTTKMKIKEKTFCNFHHCYYFTSRLPQLLWKYELCKLKIVVFSRQSKAILWDCLVLNTEGTFLHYGSSGRLRDKDCQISSCRGVAFEINPNKSNPFAIDSAPTQKQGASAGAWLWLPWNQTSSLRVVPSSNLFSPSRSHTSSHFCDIEFDDDDDVWYSAVHDIERLETANEVKVQKLLKKSDSPKDSRLSIILLDQGFTVYKYLFLACLALNLIALALSSAGHFSYAKNRATLFSIVNILALTLCRSEVVLRVVFWVAVKTLGRSCVPLRIKTATTSFLQSLGGIHSGCAISAMAWLVYSLVLTIKNKDKTSLETTAMAFAIFFLISFSSIAAFPLIRHLHHNVFERAHRFSGWMVLILVWIFILLSISYEPSSKSYNLRLSKMVKQQEYWFTLGDFTKSLISNPPRHLWVRSMHVAGLPYLVNLYQKVVLVATGSGIGVFLSFLPQPFSADVCLVWVAKDIELNYGREIKEMLSGHPKEKVIVHDTAVSGRPNGADMTIDAATKWNAQVVIVTSNPQGSRDIIRACNKVKIPAFGPI
ncbi:hypothetical protein L6164_022421 [Bauhinia variegata]|uniref:Uncharacterized protein n=1 Tax=Bauhinia variegata TaxID=167791 RepID=A0ACB9MG31_BAUVA|nr:hypothetical protein L6164_022421 [Bauhinia variegata]